ncbi:MAG: metalloregulator ArsR/SmtB family transcription factor [Eubacteriales bacterium]|nr:metalloregulator ArsR/SmtB family transcription factor [Eubacteriales bacterium]
METKTPLCSETHHHEALLASLRADAPAEGFLLSLADFFKVFGDATRVKLLLALDRADLCVCDLAELLGMTKSAVSHQLSALRAAHLVNFRREGKNVRYSLADDHVRKIIECASEHLSEDD